MNLAIFASGGGSNFQAIVDAVERGDLAARVVLCVTNHPDAGVVGRAERHGISTAVMDRQQFDSQEAFVDALIELLAAHGADFIALAGYMKMIPAEVVSRYRNRIVNIHPALLPRFGGTGMYGMNVHRAVLESGDTRSGATVHLVDEAYDTGPIVLQRTVPVEPDDTPETLAARVLESEHELYPEVLRLFAEHRVHISGKAVTIHR